MLYRFFTHKTSHNKWRFMGLLSISLFSKPVLSYTFTFFCFWPVQFLEQIPSPYSPSPFAHLLICHFLSNHPNPVSTTLTRNLKPCLIYELSLAKAVFCSSAVLITTPSSSMHFFCFFDVLPSAPTTTGMILMLLMFRILLISLFSSWYLSIFLLLFFTNSHISRYSNINFGTSCLTLIHYNNIWFSCFFSFIFGYILS